MEHKALVMSPFKVATFHKGLDLSLKLGTRDKLQSRVPSGEALIKAASQSTPQVNKALAASKYSRRPVTSRFNTQAIKDKFLSRAPSEVASIKLANPSKQEAQHPVLTAAGVSQFNSPTKLGTCHHRAHKQAAQALYPAQETPESFKVLLEEHSTKLVSQLTPQYPFKAVARPLARMRVAAFPYSNQDKQARRLSTPMVLTRAQKEKMLSKAHSAVHSTRLASPLTFHRVRRDRTSVPRVAELSS